MRHSDAVDDPGDVLDAPALTWTDVESGRPATTGPQPAVLRRGDIIGRYVVLDVVGAGAMGTVYAAFDPELERKVALKLLHVQEDRDPDSSRGHARILREARALARLADPNVVGVHDVGLWEGRAFVAMELLEGQTLGRWCAERARRWPEIVAKLLAAARGLAAAHRAGIVHADFKPDNVLVGGDGRVCVTDFGLARATRRVELDVQVTGRSRGSDDLALSRTRVGIGTPAYMSPEQYMQLEPDATSDQFSFGVTAYEALWGRRPFAGQTITELAANVMQGSPREPPRDRPVPAHVRRAVMRALSHAPADRYPDMDALVAELARDPAATRRRVLASVAAVGLGVAAAVGLARATDRDALCAGAPQHVAARWNDDRRDDIAQAFAATALPYAEDARLRVESALDDWSARWQGAHVEACEATHVRGEQSQDLLDRRMACLSRALDETGAMIDQLATADATVVARASEAVAELPALDRCADALALLSRPTPPPDLADAVEDVRQRLARARAQERAGLYADARTTADALVAEADALGWTPLRAEAHARLGSIRAHAGDYPGAASELREAWGHALAGAEDELAAAVATDLVEVLGHGIADIDDALAWGEHARAELLRIGSPTRADADLHDAIGIALAAAGRWSQALEEHGAALALRERMSDHAGLDSTLLNLGRALESLGREAESLEVSERALAMRIAERGPHHPDVAVAHNTAGNALFSLARNDEALQHFAAALAIRKAALGPRHPHVGTSLNNIGNVWARRGDPAQAEQHYRQALEIWQEALGPEHPHTLKARLNLAVTLKQQERYEEALTEATAALTIEEKLRGPEDAEIAMSLVNVGNILDALGRHGEAIDRHTRALKILERTPDATTGALATVRTDLGIALLGAGKAAAARKELERASAALDGVDHAYAEMWLGRAEVAQGDREQGVQRIEAALEEAKRSDAPESTRTEIERALLSARDR